MSNGYILIVDDEANSRRLLTRLLEDAGYTIRLATSGERAFTIINNKQPHLILLDVNMPMMNGFEVCERLKKQPDTQDIPVIFISALHGIFYKVRAFEAGGVDYITKPFKSKEILVRIQTHITLRQTQIELQSFNSYLQKKVHTRTALLRQALYNAKHNQAQIQAVFDNVVDGIVVANAHGIIQSVNPAMETIFGYTKSEMIGQNVTLLMPKTYQIEHKSYIDRYHQAGRSVYHIMGNERELMGQHKNGSSIPVMVTLSDFEFKQERMLTAIIRDMTAVKQAEQERLTLIAIQQELSTAQEMQRSLLPSPVPQWPGIDAICYCVPAREVGGDFYAYHAFELPLDLKTQQHGGSYMVAVGDVSGKGVSAALLMSVSLALFQAALRQELSPQELLTYLDETLQPYIQSRRQNCALVCAEINQANRNQATPFMVRIANAGCIPPYIKRADGSVDFFEIGGFALGQGLGSYFGYEQMSLTLTSGDMIILVSDGVVEANDATGKMLGFESLYQIVQVGPLHSARAMLNHLKQQIFSFTGGAEQYDDITIVVVRL